MIYIAQESFVNPTKYFARADTFDKSIYNRHMFNLILIFTSQLIFANTTLVLPDAHAFRGWTPVEGYVTSNLRFDRIPRVQLNCPADPNNLYPTHPDQGLKAYHRFDGGSYNHFQLTAESEACTMGGNYKDGHGLYPCLRPDAAYRVEMSDIYRDKCGNLYRGYWNLLYLKKWESMGTLFSKGRTMYVNPNSQFSGDYVMGPTYRVPLSDFLFLGAPWAGDRERAAEQAARALQRTHNFDSLTLLFNTK